jgi:hypothetical protein
MNTSVLRNTVWETLAFNIDRTLRKNKSTKHFPWSPPCMFVTRHLWDKYKKYGRVIQTVWDHVLYMPNNQGKNPYASQCYVRHTLSTLVCSLLLSQTAKSSIAHHLPDKIKSSFHLNCSATGLSVFYQIFSETARRARKWISGVKHV